MVFLFVIDIFYSCLDKTCKLSQHVLYLYSFIRFLKEEMAKCAVDLLLRHPIENVQLQVKCVY